MVSAGNSLVEALSLEREFRRVDTEDDEEALKRWRQSKAAVELMAERYTVTLTRWREAIQAHCRAEEYEEVKDKKRSERLRSQNSGRFD